MGVTVGCATAPVSPEKTQLQLREFETRTYEANDTKLVMKAMLNVLQDEGYIVKNAIVELGLLTPTKEMDVENPTVAFWASVLGGRDARWNKNSIVEATANVSDHGTQSRVRVDSGDSGDSLIHS